MIKTDFEILQEDMENKRNRGEGEEEVENKRYKGEEEEECGPPGTESDTLPLPPGESESENKRKRITEGAFECRLLISSKMSGAVIGKKGCNIQKLREDFSNANIQIPDAPGPERVMRITTDDLSIIPKIVEASMPFLFEDESEFKDKEIRLLYHKYIVGGIIGKGGVKIKEIREASGTIMTAFPNVAPQSSDRVVSIKGLKDSVIEALKLVVEVARVNSESVGREFKYDPGNFDDYYANEYGGWGEGAGGGFVKNSRGRGGRYNFDRGPRGFGRGGGWGGGFDGYDMGGFGFGRGSARSGGGFGRGGGGRHNFGEDDGGFRDFVASLGEEEEGAEKETQEVTIKKHMGGAIIGPKGQRVRYITGQCGAYITIGDVNEDDERIVSIEGTKKQIQMAKWLLQKAVREHTNSGGRY